MKHVRRESILRYSRLLFSCVVVLLLVAGCGSGDGAENRFQRNQPTISSAPDEKSVFIAHLTLSDLDTAALDTIRYVIAPKPNHFAAPIQATYTRAALEQRGLLHINEKRLELPVSGLYSDYANTVSIEIIYNDGDSQRPETVVGTGVFVDEDNVYDNLTVTQAVTAETKPTIDYFYLKSKSGLTIIDIDGEVRWHLPGLQLTSTIFLDNHFFSGANDSNTLYTIELDGSYTTRPMPAGRMVTESFHHDFASGKHGILTMPDGMVGDAHKLESFITEITPRGEILKEWDLGEILSDYLQANGDDPARLVQDGVDWFHLNSMIYDPRDDTILASSRIHFIMKMDYETGKIIWLFGDPTKDWYVNIPSLRALGVNMANNGVPPIGQHSLSVANDGSLMLFNNGLGSNLGDPSRPDGEALETSRLAKYVIDDDSRLAELNWEFDDGLTSPVCSSVYQSDGGDYLALYSSILFTQAVIQIVNEQQQKLFEMQFASTACNHGFNASLLDLTDQRFTGAANE